MQSGRLGNLPYVIARNGCPKIDCHREARSAVAISPGADTCALRRLLRPSAEGLATTGACHCEEPRLYRDDVATSPVRPQPERLLRPSAEGLATTGACHCEEPRLYRDDVAISPVRPQPERLLRPSAEGLATTGACHCEEPRLYRDDVAISNRLVT